MYTQGTDYQTGATTNNYSTQQYNYQYQYQMPTTQTTTTTTKQVTTTQPITYTQQFTTSQPDYTQAFTQQTYTTSGIPQTYSTTLPQTYTTTATTSIPTYTESIPGFTTSAVPSYTTSIPGYTTTATTTTTSIPTYTTTATTSIPGVVPGAASYPGVQILRQGSGISPNEQNGIISTSVQVLQSGITPISNNTASRIKKVLGGDWLVIVYGQGKPVDFNMTCVQGNDYLYFTYNGMAFQVCRLR